jgi:hypothetical protein
MRAGVVAMLERAFENYGHRLHAACGCVSNPFGAPNQSSLRKRNGEVFSQPSAPMTSCLFST